MGSGAVPVLVALAHTEQAPVPHIDGDEQLLPRLGGHSPLPQDHGVGIDIVVDGSELLLHMEFHALDDLVHHGLPVEHGEVLDDLHIVDILLKQFSRHISESLGDVGLLDVFQFLQFFLDLLLPALCLHLGHQRLQGGIISTVEYLIARLLVIAGHLYTQVTAAGVDHDVEISLVVLVHLDEVVPTAQRTDAFFCPEEIHMAGTAQFAQVDLIEVAVGLIPDGEAGGDFFINQLVQLLKLQPPLPDAGGLHAAPDVHTHQIGHRPIDDGHGGADGTALAGVNVGHEPDAAARRKFLIAQLLNLCDGGAVHHIGEDLGLIVFSFDFDHNFLAIFYGAWPRQVISYSRAASPCTSSRWERSVSSPLCTASVGRSHSGAISAASSWRSCSRRAASSLDANSPSNRAQSRVSSVWGAGKRTSRSSLYSHQSQIAMYTAPEQLPLDNSCRRLFFIR